MRTKFGISLIHDLVAILVGVAERVAVPSGNHERQT